MALPYVVGLSVLAAGLALILVSRLWYWMSWRRHERGAQTYLLRPTGARPQNLNDDTAAGADREPPTALPEDTPPAGDPVGGLAGELR